MSKPHTIKIHPEYFQDLIEGRKTFEIRKNDRNYEVGQNVYLKEFDPEKEIYTGNSIIASITYISDFQQKDDYIVMSIVINESINDQTEKNDDIILAYFDFETTLLDKENTESNETKIALAWGALTTLTFANIITTEKRSIIFGQFVAALHDFS